MEKLTHDQQRQIAFKILKAYRIHPSVSNAFGKGRKNHRLFYSERASATFPAVLYWLDNEPEYARIAKEYADRTGSLVFHAILTHTEFGDLLDVLAVPNDVADAIIFEAEASRGNFMSYCYNLTTGEAECGTIGVRPAMGGLKRVA